MSACYIKFGSAKHRTHYFTRRINSAKRQTMEIGMNDDLQTWSIFFHPCRFYETWAVYISRISRSNLMKSHENSLHKTQNDIIAISLRSWLQMIAKQFHDQSCQCERGITASFLLQIREHSWNSHEIFCAVKPDNILPEMNLITTLIISAI